MPNYENGKIYKLVSPHTDEIYIGSTTQKLCVRIAEHKRDCREGKIRTNKKLFELGDVKIVLIEDFPCDRKEELIKRERYYIENTDCLNIMIPGRTRKEYYQDNKEIISEKKKDYREKNKEIIAQRKKEYCQKNKEKVAQRKKQYRENNKEKINKINEKKRKEKYTCQCGLTIRKDSKARHEKTIKHQNYLLQNN